MRFFEFLESRYVSTNIEIQKEYTLAKQGEIQAGQALISAQRTFFKWLSFPKLLGLFVLVNLRLIAKPKTAKEIATELHLAQAKAKEDEKAKEPDATTADQPLTSGI